MQIIIERLVHGPQDGVPLPDEKRPAWGEERADHPCPIVDTRQPAQRADAGVHEFKIARAQNLYCIMYVCVNKPDIRSGL